MRKKKDVYTQLCECALRNDIVVLESCTRDNGIVGVYIQLPNEQYITSVASEIADPYTRVELLAYEIGLCSTKWLYNVSSSSAREYQKDKDRLANLWAIGYIMPPARIEKAFERDIRSISGLAKHFDVSPGFVKNAFLEYVNGNYQQFMNDYFFDIDTTTEGEKEE